MSLAKKSHTYCHSLICPGSCPGAFFRPPGQLGSPTPIAAIIVVSHKTLKFDLVNKRIAEARAPGVDYVVACSSAALPFGRGYNCEIDRLDEFGNSRA